METNRSLMRNPELTKENIIEKAAVLFNTKGFAGTSIQDIMDDTGLKKGGIYRHFNSKEELAAEAFRFAYQKLKRAYTEALAGAETPDQKLFFFLSALKEFALNPPVKGGCPIMNTAIEADDTNPALRDEVKKAANEWESIVRRIFEEGITRKIFAPTVDAAAEARFLVLTIEGAIMLGKLHKSSVYIDQVAEILTMRIRSFCT